MPLEIAGIPPGKSAMVTSDEFGPKMRRLPPNEMAFVCMLFKNPRSPTRALEQADPEWAAQSPNRNALRQKAHMLMHTQRIVDAVREESKRRTVFLLPRAQMALENALDNPQSDAHKFAVKTVRDDAGVSMAVERVLNINVTQVSQEDKMKALVDFAAKHGGTILGVPIEAVKVETTDAEYEEVRPPSTTGLEDLL